MSRKLTEAERAERSAQLMSTMVDAAVDVLRDRGWLVFVPGDRAGWEGALQSAPTDVLAAALARAGDVSALCGAIAEREDELADKPSLVADLALDDDDRDKVMRAWGVDLDRRDGEEKIGELAARLAWCEDWAEWRKLQLRLREELKCVGLTSARTWALLG